MLYVKLEEFIRQTELVGKVTKENATYFLAPWAETDVETERELAVARFKEIFPTCSNTEVKKDTNQTS